MSNTIKLKRGSGSDPGASDLSVGEIAIRTDNGKLFTKKDNGSVAEISGSGGIDDGDKGDITVSNGGDTFTIDNGVVTSAKIADGTIVNADINASAGISFSKMSVLSANTIVGRRVSNGVPQELTAGQVRTILNVEDGATADQSKSDIDALGIAASTAATLATARTIGGVSFNGSANINLPGVNTSGNQNTSGNAATATTSTRVTVTDNSSDTSCFVLFTQAATGNQLPHSGSNLTFNASSGLLTATSFSGNGANLTNLPSQTDNNFTNADHSKLDGIEAGATADQSASEILTLLKTVDGSGSGLDADTLDGLSSGSFVRSDGSDTLSGNYTFTSSSQYPITIGSTSGMNNGRLLLRGATSPYIQFKEDNTDKAFIQWHSDGYFRIANEEDGSQLRIQDDIKFSLNGSTFYSMWHAGNDGANSGLDADILDGQHGSYYLNYNNFSNTPTIPTNNNQLTNGAGYITSANGGNAATLDSLDSTDFLRSSAADTASSDITFSGGAGAATIAAGSDISFSNGDWTGNHTKIQHHSNTLYVIGGSSGIIFRESGTNRVVIDGSGHLIPGSSNTYNLGSSSFRWANLFVNDMHFANSPENPNKVDGTWGDWTLQEGEDQIYMLNNRNGKKYAMNLTEIV